MAKKKVAKKFDGTALEEFDPGVLLRDLIKLAHEQKFDLTVSFDERREELVPGEYEAEGVVEMTPPVLLPNQAGSKPLFKGTTKAWGAHFKLQTARDGRVWVCLDGVTVLRFKPNVEAKK
jgi:hypothetical protein